MRRITTILGVLLLSLTGINCGGAKPVDTIGDDDDFNLETETGDTAEEEADGFDPVAVGFELMSGIDGNGNLVNFTVDATEYPSQILVTFAGLQYFDDGDEDSTCTINGFWQPAPLTDPLEVNGSEGPTVLFHSYEEPLFLDPSTNTCTNMHSKWGLNGEDLIEKFDGMRFGMGFGEITDYLKEAWSEETIESHGDAMFSTYIAMNHPAGNGVDFIGQDWTTGIMVEWDEDTHEPMVDDSDIYVPLPITGLIPGPDALPEGYILQNAYWYEDFPLIDLDLLK